MAPEPRRVDVNRVPLELFIRACATNPLAFDIVDDSGMAFAREVPDLHTARVLATAPRLLDSFYEMTWVLNTWFVHGFNGVEISEHRGERETEIDEWLKGLDEVQSAACAPGGRFPL